ncbi:MAG: hypothetical protein UW43_C0008G0030 [Candidatus Yanofskybacteria bacterium GW2011_GWA1_44_21]|uniref:Uncharacterized protein n=3 Tax=Parcubacteria group TaxID=1794811 RepID=A0A0G1AIS5_9BACT|nr:MAG: hypothetical protein UU85_C0006G0026 [Candidatus Wolfebacteria bacterium GW2011_GWA2_42_10]KKT50340.1 MAG: hypothetical protein UW43_C0008G0030 [Candidatus Yanofskybacteria bacterium GW2011_GWA1_44_21]KKT90179.1 MAG: hypothetical protein UW90_C0005G0034 [Candidatus Yanofskybacteria bacterium GW2011_GWB1_45_11]OGN02164.1 MAG: hypothetical protein A2657_01535 [Candidatus Yanofskybacteria bacterium RIFCSPHIGHO2_01_FULL_44_110b]OGN14594.1 MAG: hypothetical protein A3C01_00010 [Candidatus Ya
MALTPTQEKIADRIGELLAESLLDEETKDLILSNLGNIPENLVNSLLSALEAEHEKLDEVTAEIQTFIKEQDGDWQTLETNQQNYAAQFMEKALKNLEAEAEIEDIKSSM